MHRRSLRVVLIAALAVVSCGEGERGELPVVPPPETGRAPAPPGSKVFPMTAAAALDHPARDAWQRPDEVVAALRVRPGDRVGDVGCGTGYFALRLLDAVGPEGHVVAVDIQQGMLDLLAGRLRAGDAERATLRCSAPERPLEATDALDLVLCANTLKEVPDEDAAGFVQSMADGLAPGGRLVVLDWLPEPTDLGPPLAHRIAPERVVALAEQAGLRLSEVLDLLPTHSFQVFTKPREP